MPDDEAATRDPVNCAGCLREWITDTRKMLDALEANIERPETLAHVEATAVHGNGVAPH